MSTCLITVKLAMLLLIWIIQPGHSTGSIYPQMNEKQQRPLIDIT